jgi:uncharacterized protein YhaN
MRLRRLDVTRFGKFTNLVLDFGEHEADRPDLHLVYGANEAGKTTVLAAYLDLLFGIEMRSRFDFIHTYDTMRIGACLEHDGVAQELVRIKRRQNTLLGADHQPLPERLIAARLGGIDRESYRAMFSLDDDTIERGGESILESKGDLGQLLFAASAGLSELSQTLAGLKAEADRFYKSGTRAGELAELKAQADDLQARRRAIDTAAAAHARLREAREETGARYTAALAARRDSETHIRAIERTLAALPRLADLRDLHAGLADLADVPEAPAGWAESFPSLEKEDNRLAGQWEGICAEIDRRSAELAGISLDGAALAVADRVSGWQSARARAEHAAQDIPVVRNAAQAQEVTIAALLARLDRLGCTDPRRLVPGPAQANALWALIEARAGIEVAIAKAQDEVAQARLRLEEAMERQHLAAPDDAGGPDSGEAALSAVAAAIAGVQSADHAARRRLAERDREAALSELGDLLAQLQPWQGDAAELAAMRVPDPATLQAWQSALATTERELDAHARERTRLDLERHRLEALRTALTGSGGVVGDADAALLRAAREEAWARHRRALDADTADRFEAALRRDDMATDSRLRREQDIARLGQLTEQLADLLARSRNELTLREQAATRQGATLAAIAAAIAAMSGQLPGDMPLETLDSWLRRRERALESSARLAKAQVDLSDAEQDAAAARSALVQALAAAGIAHESTWDIAVLLPVAQAALDRDSRLRGLRGEVATLRRAADRRERVLADAQRAASAWEEAWRATCAESWLRELGPVPPLAVVRDNLQVSAELGPALEARDDKLRRIAEMQSAQSAFAAEVASVAGALGLPPEDDALAQARALTARVEAAVQARELRAGRASELEDALARQRTLAASRSALARQRNELTEYFGVASLAEAGVRLQQAARKAELRIQVARAERDILEALSVATIAEAEALLASADAGAARMELARLKAEFDMQDQRVREIYAEHSRACERIDAIDGDGTAASLEEQRRTVLLQIEDKALEYLRLRIGIAAAEQALRLYRQRHQSAMMARASEAFRTMTGGAYSGLTSQPDREREVLVAIPAGGGSKAADTLSKGTRFQLYLALRMAGYDEFARQRHPVPFIADDIMETFDDFRAERALGLLAEMAQVGQVIYLTHHRHLCEIAARACPGVRVHELH